MKAAMANLQSRNAQIEVQDLSMRLAALQPINLHSKTSYLRKAEVCIHILTPFCNLVIFNLLPGVPKNVAIL